MSSAYTPSNLFNFPFDIVCANREYCDQTTNMLTHQSFMFAHVMLYIFTLLYLWFWFSKIAKSKIPISTSIFTPSGDPSITISNQSSPTPRETLYRDFGDWWNAEGKQSGRAKLGSLFILYYIILRNKSQFVAGKVGMEDRDVAPKTNKYSTNRFTTVN